MFLRVLRQSAPDKECKPDKMPDGSSQPEISGLSNDVKDMPDNKRDAHFHASKKEVKTRKLKSLKKDKIERNSDPFRFEGEGVLFKAKLIGSETVSDARGDKMCQDAMQQLKAIVKTSGEHKQRVILSVSLYGIKIKDEKSNELVYHHPVHKISFISQDVSDARAFGYVCGSPQGGHRFIAIKTEKTASQVVIALRDLFQVVLEMKQHEMQRAKENQEKQKLEVEGAFKGSMSEANGDQWDGSSPGASDEAVYEVVESTAEERPAESSVAVAAPKNESVPTVDDLLDLQFELDSLQQGIKQIETTIAAAAFLGTEKPEKDPFDTSFVTQPNVGSFQLLPPVPLVSTPAVSSESPVPPPIPARTIPAPPVQSFGDRYSVFTAFDSTPSVFETLVTSPEKTEGEIANILDPFQPFSVAQSSVLNTVTPTTEALTPRKPPRCFSSDFFADLDPLGRDRPYKDKSEFFHELKNPPKKVLRELAGSEDGNQSFSDSGVMVPPSPPSSVSSGVQNLCAMSNVDDSGVFVPSDVSSPVALNNWETFDDSLSSGDSKESSPEKPPPGIPPPPPPPLSLSDLPRLALPPSPPPRPINTLRKVLPTPTDIMGQLYSVSSPPIPIPSNKQSLPFRNKSPVQNGSVSSGDTDRDHFDYVSYTAASSSGTSPGGPSLGKTPSSTCSDNGFVSCSSTDVVKPSRSDSPNYQKMKNPFNLDENLNNICNQSSTSLPITSIVNGSAENGLPGKTPSVRWPGETLSSESSAKTNGVVHVNGFSRLFNEEREEMNIFQKKSDPFADEFFTTLQKKPDTTDLKNGESHIQNWNTKSFDWLNSQESIYATINKKRKD